MGKSQLAAISIWAIVFAAVGAWPLWSMEPFPLPGLQKLSEGNPVMRLFQVAAVVCFAVWLAFPRWHTRDRLLVFQGATYTLGFLGFLQLGIAFGLAFICFASIARQHADQTIVKSPISK